MLYVDGLALYYCMHMLLVVCCVHSYWIIDITDMFYGYSGCEYNVCMEETFMLLLVCIGVDMIHA